MDNNNSFNNLNNEDNTPQETQPISNFNRQQETPPQTFTEYKAPQNSHPIPDIQPVENSMPINEVAYIPFQENETAKPPKKSKGKNVLKVLGATAAIFAVSIVSIYGYTLVTQGDMSAPFANNGQVAENNNNASASTDIASKIDEVSTAPTFFQMTAEEGGLLHATDIYDKVVPSVVGVSSTLVNGGSTGTGIILSEDGYILTNAHVVEDAFEVTVLLNINTDEYEEVKATVVGSDEQTDIAVLKIDKTGLTAAELGVSSELEIGEFVMAIGNPLGFEFANTATSGMVSGLDRQFTMESYSLNLIQTDAAINSGNSGGPLVNSYGQIIGITSSKISQQYAESLGFAIPIDEAMPIIEDLVQYGYVRGRPQIGIGGQDLEKIWADFNDIPQGIIVLSITEDSGAADAGLQINDIIIGVDGKPVTTMDELNTYKEEHQAGDTMRLLIYRDGETLEVDVVLSEAKE